MVDSASAPRRAASAPANTSAVEECCKQQGGTYEAGQRVIEDYNVMASAKAALDCHVRYLAAELGPQNTRVNAISAGPIRTLSASAVKSLAKGRALMAERSPLRRNVDTADVADVAVFLASSLSRCLTGEILNADNGLHILGM